MSRGDTIALWSLVVAIATAGIGLTTPEIRCWLRLPSEACARVPTPNLPESSTPDPEPKPPSETQPEPVLKTNPPLDTSTVPDPEPAPKEPVEPTPILPDPSSEAPWGTASKSWCLGMVEQWEVRKNVFGKDDASIRASLDENNCAHWGVTLPQ